jgi:hypothetical protein
MFLLDSFRIQGHTDFVLNSGSKNLGRYSMRELTLEEIEVVTGGMPIVVDL